MEDHRLGTSVVVVHDSMPAPPHLLVCQEHSDLENGPRCGSPRHRPDPSHRPAPPADVTASGIDRLDLTNECLAGFAHCIAEFRQCRGITVGAGVIQNAYPVAHERLGRPGAPPLCSGRDGRRTSRAGNRITGRAERAGGRLDWCRGPGQRSRFRIGATGADQDHREGSDSWRPVAPAPYPCCHDPDSPDRLPGSARTGRMLGNLLRSGGPGYPPNAGLWTKAGRPERGRGSRHATHGKWRETTRSTAANPSFAATFPGQGDRTRGPEKVVTDDIIVSE